MDETDDNWLRAEHITCPHCAERLFAVIHSPFCDDYRLYCDRCPCAVEVSFYDPVCVAAVSALPKGRTWEQTMAAIEPLLRPCRCGGQFRGNAPRHCFRCGAILPAAVNKDLYPHHVGVEPHGEPTVEEQEQFDRFEADFILRKDLWSSGSGPARDRDGA